MHVKGDVLIPVLIRLRCLKPFATYIDVYLHVFAFHMHLRWPVCRINNIHTPSQADLDGPRMAIRDAELSYHRSS